MNPSSSINSIQFIGIMEYWKNGMLGTEMDKI